MKRSLFLFFILLYLSPGFSQNISPVVLSTAGETFQNNTVLLDWTIGELAISNIQNASHQITQGFHQPFYIITSVQELPAAIGKIKLFPNPASDFLTMELSFDEFSIFHLQLFDANGKLIWTKTKEGKEIKEHISLGDLSNGNYFLHFIIDERLYSQTFSIQKIK